jgi:hypothetical protein
VQEAAKRSLCPRMLKCAWQARLTFGCDRLRWWRCGLSGAGGGVSRPRAVLKSEGFDMRSIGNWIKLAAFGFVIVGVVSATYARIPESALRGRCCLRRGAETRCFSNLSYDVCVNSRGVYNRGVTCNDPIPCPNE